jgi:hypothetical protein
VKCMIFCRPRFADGEPEVPGNRHPDLTWTRWLEKLIVEHAVEVEALVITRGDFASSERH